MEERISYTAKEVVKITGMPRSLVYKLIRNGKLQSVRVSDRRIIIPAWSLQKLLGKEREEKEE